MVDTAVISLPERFDFSFHENFTEQSTKILEQEKVQAIRVDFSRVLYLDSSALGLLVLLFRKSESRNIKLIISGARGAAKDILEVSHMHKMYAFE